MTSVAARPRVVHVVDRLNTGGMESVLLAVVGATLDCFDHVIIELRGSGEWAARAEAMQVPVESIGKKPGKDPLAYVRLLRRLRALNPDIVHSYNVGTLDVAVFARLAGCRTIVHAEHGRDASDPEGESRKYRLLRRLISPFISRFVPVSIDLERWLAEGVGISPARISMIRNGVDTARFAPHTDRSAPDAWPAKPATKTIGTVGRLDPVKGFEHLVRAVALLKQNPTAPPVHLMIVGDGPMREPLSNLIRELGLEDTVTLMGLREDVDQLLAHFDCYVCSSIAEGTALTLLEAMAAGKPIVATATGGNPELVTDGNNGLLVPVAAPEAIADALLRILSDDALSAGFGQAARRRAETEFGLESMVAAYRHLYTALLAH